VVQVWYNFKKKEHKMNPASRLYSHIKLISRFKNTQSTTLFDIYSKIFNAKSIFKIYEKLELLNKEVKKVEFLFLNSGKIDKYKSMIISLEKITTPKCLTQQLSTIYRDIETTETILMVLSDAFESTPYEENNIENNLESIQKDLDSFLQKIKTLNINDSVKLLYTNITYKLKHSIECYSISGASLLKEELKLFECILKDAKEAKPIIDKIHNAIDVANKTKDIIGFTADAAKLAMKFLGE